MCGPSKNRSLALIICGRGKKEIWIVVPAFKGRRLCQPSKDSLGWFSPARMGSLAAGDSFSDSCRKYLHMWTSVYITHVSLCAAECPFSVLLVFENATSQGMLRFPYIFLVKSLLSTQRKQKTQFFGDRKAAGGAWNDKGKGSGKPVRLEKWKAAGYGYLLSFFLGVPYAVVVNLQLQ